MPPSFTNVWRQTNSLGDSSRRGAVTTTQPTAKGQGNNASSICNLLLRLGGRRHRPPIKSCHRGLRTDGSVRAAIRNGRLYRDPHNRLRTSRDGAARERVTGKKLASDLVGFLGTEDMRYHRVVRSYVDHPRIVAIPPRLDPPWPRKFYFLPKHCIKSINPHQKSNV